MRLKRNSHPDMCVFTVRAPRVLEMSVNVAGCPEHLLSHRLQPTKRRAASVTMGSDPPLTVEISLVEYESPLLGSRGKQLAPAAMPFEVVCVGPLWAGCGR